MVNTVFPGPDFSTRNIANRQSQDRASWWQYPPNHDESTLWEPLSDGDKQFNLISMDNTEQEVPGAFCPQFVVDYYFRIYVTPSSISLGNLVSTQIRTFEVWNAFFEPKLNNALNVAGDTTGVILTEPAVPPTTYQALEVRQYQIQFDLVGPAAISLLYDWEFPAPDNPTLRVTGNRAIIWSIPPDWSETVSERYEWLTSIIEAENGLEDRYRHRFNPRRSIEYRFLINEREKRWLERYLWAWKGRVFSIPLWMDCSFTTNAITINDTVIDLDTTVYKSFVPGGVAIIWDGYDQTEAVEILTVNPTSLGLTRGALNNWPAGTRIYPAQVGRMREDISISQPTADITYGRILFEFLENEAITAVDAPTAYDDSTVLLRQPNRADDLELNFSSKYGLVDFGITQPLVDERSDFPAIVTSLSFAEDTREDVWFWKEWLHARAGRWSKFYMPAWSRDFTLVSDVFFNSASIEVVDNEYRTFYNLDPVKRDIMFKKSDGTIVVRRITSAIEKAPAGSGVEILQLDSPTGVDFPVAETLMVSFVHPSRLDTDGVEFEWDSVNIARINFNTRTIPQ